MQKLNWQYKTDLEKAGLRVAKLLQHGLALTPGPSPEMGEGSSNLKRNHFQAFWVGGVVRNMLMKRESDNIDIATNATPEQIEEILTKARITNKPVGKKFGSILAIVNRYKIEITTFRAESRYSDKRHPDQVEFIHDYLQDAKRRDFTINALYFDPVKKELYDPTGGIKDLGLRLLRFVGDPKKRLEEDALRMLRGVRLATQLGFKLEKNSFAAIKTRAKYIQGISGERIKAELDKILLSKNRAAGIRLLDEIGLLKFILPELTALKKFSHNAKEFHLEGDMFEHTLLALENARTQDLNLHYAILLHDIGKPLRARAVGRFVKTTGHAEIGAEVFKKIAQRLKFSRPSRQLIAWAIGKHMVPLRFPNLTDREKAEIALHPDIDFLMQLALIDDLANLRLRPDGTMVGGGSKKLPAAQEFLNQAAKRKVKVETLSNSRLIMKYSGLPPGRELGQKIQDVKVQIILGKIKNESDLKDYLK